MNGRPTTTDAQAPEQTTVILGLDFDGVLHPMNDAAAGRFCRLPLLEAWLREHNGVDVVITSSWHESNSLEELRSHFAEDVRQRVVGVTPLAHRLFGPAWSRSPAERAEARYVRQAELEAWRREAGRDSESWLALDDDPALYNKWTDPVTGEIVPSYTMLTLNCDGHPLLSRMHKPDPKLPPDRQDKRTVVPLEPSVWGQWLAGSVDEARALIQVPPVEVYEGPAPRA